VGGLLVRTEEDVVDDHEMCEHGQDRGLLGPEQASYERVGHQLATSPRVTGRTQRVGVLAEVRMTATP
jgi:hypothetical protein